MLCVLPDFYSLTAEEPKKQQQQRCRLLLFFCLVLLNFISFLFFFFFFSKCLLLYVSCSAILKGPLYSNVLVFESPLLTGGMSPSSLPLTQVVEGGTH